MERNITLLELCRALGLEHTGTDVRFDGLNLCNRSSEHRSILTYATSPDYAETVRSNPAVTGLVVTPQDYSAYEKIVRQREMGVILCEEPEKTFYDIHDYLFEHTDFYDKFTWPSKIGKNPHIHPTAVIEDGVIIGDDVTIGPNSVVRSGTVVGDRCVIGCNSTVGSEGFQVLRIGGRNRKIVHCGGVVLEEDVWIGDNNTVARALFEGATVVGRNTKVDNLVYIAHNVTVGADVVLTSGTLLCGSSMVESQAWIGVNSSVLNRVTVGANAKIGMGSVVTRDVPPNTLAYGNPARNKRTIN